MLRKRPHAPHWYAKEWIAHKALRQADIVSRTDFNKGQVSDYVTGRRRWNQDVLEAFARAIGVEAPDLLRPPQRVENDLAAYVMAMDEKRQRETLRLLKALAVQDGEKVA